jgi:capsular polysaccharide biosynthesis protein
MSEQALDLRRFVRIVRRHKMLVGIVAALGLLLGAAYAVLSPPALSSKVVVVFPSPPSSIATQVVVATSNPVLSGALPHISPAVSLNTLRSQVQARSLTAYLIQITAKGPNAAKAEANADAVANSYVAYVTSGRGVVSVAAKIFQPATTASGTPLVEQLIINALLGVIGGGLIGAIVALTISRKDRQLRTRDELANAMGLPVLASLPAGHPADAAGWTKLLEDYHPGAMHSWWLRNALKELGVLGGNVNNGHRDAGSSLTIVSLASDQGALALGPQLAHFAASLGIPTDLVIGPAQDAAATAALRTACAVPPPASSKRPGNLRVRVADGNDTRVQPDAALTVLLVTVDAKAPKFPATMRTTATVFGVSAGGVTADQLAQTAVTALADGREVAGFLVADPEPTDHTAGRAPQLIRGGTVQVVRVPERANGSRHRGPERNGSPERYRSPARPGSPERNGSPERQGSPERPGSPERHGASEGRGGQDQAAKDVDQTMIFSTIRDGSATPTTEIKR